MTRFLRPWLAHGLAVCHESSGEDDGVLRDEGGQGKPPSDPLDQGGALPRGRILAHVVADALHVADAGGAVEARVGVLLLLGPHERAEPFIVDRAALPRHGIVLRSGLLGPCDHPALHAGELPAGLDEGAPALAAPLGDSEAELSFRQFLEFVGSPFAPSPLFGFALGRPRERGWTLTRWRVGNGPGLEAADGVFLLTCQKVDARRSKSENGRAEKPPVYPGLCPPESLIGFREPESRVERPPPPFFPPPFSRRLRAVLRPFDGQSWRRLNDGKPMR